MALLDTIKSDQLTARKNKNAIATALLSTLIGEATKVGSDGGRDRTDADVVGTIKKFIKGAEETKALVAAKGGDVSGSEAELSILIGYLPKQMSDEELRAAIVGFKQTKPDAKMGDVMAHLKATYGSGYDGKQASAITKEVLAS